MSCMTTSYAYTYLLEKTSLASWMIYLSYVPVKTSRFSSLGSIRVCDSEPLIDILAKTRLEAFILLAEHACLNNGQKNDSRQQSYPQGCLTQTCREMADEIV